MQDYASQPGWFRYAVIAAAVLLLCSCQATETPTVRGQSPEPPLACLAGAGCPICQTPPGVAPGVGHDEWLCDGGDFHLPAAVRRDGRVVGLEQEDSVAHYETFDGRTVVTPSSQVCIYAPRFGAARKVIDLHEYQQSAMLLGAVHRAAPTNVDERAQPATGLAQTEPVLHRRNVPPGLLSKRRQAGGLERRRRAAAVVGTLAPYANLQVVRTGQAEWAEKVSTARSSLAALTWTADQGAQVVLGVLRAKAEVSLQQPGVIYQTEEPDRSKLRVIKLASTDHALPGDEVEFTFRLDNVGARTIGRVSLIDNLTTRLEYVEESQQSTLPADFQTHPNEGGSLVLEWDFNEPLKPGEGGVVRFRCRVR